MTKTCNKCQAIPRYSLWWEGITMPVLSCWPHLQRQIDEMLSDRHPEIKVGRHL